MGSFPVPSPVRPPDSHDLRRTITIILNPCGCPLLTRPERARRTVLAIGEVFALLVGAAHVPDAGGDGLDPMLPKNSMISRRTFGFVVTSVATHRMMIGSAFGDLITSAAILVVILSSGP